MRDPLFVEERVANIAQNSKATPEMVRTMNEIKVHSAIFQST